MGISQQIQQETLVGISDLTAVRKQQLTVCAAKQNNNQPNDTPENDIRQSSL
jgi:hypothetical protein